MKILSKSVIICAFFAVFLSAYAQAQTKEKVILDTDMVEIFDDGIAMMMLQNAPNIELLGVTTVIGNSWVAEGTAWALRQLEAINATHIPVAMGVTRLLHHHRYETMPLERQLYGINTDSWAGSFGYPEPESWQSVYKKEYGFEPKVSPIEQHAVDFLIEQIKKYPGEVTIAAIGTCTNLALAIRKAPEIVPLVKRIVYMGGSFFRQGNVTPTAEFNWWADPEAAKITVRSPFKEQIVVGLDVTRKVTFKKPEYEKVRSLVTNPIITDMLNRNVLVKLYNDNEDYTHYIWDVIVAAILIDPSLITEEVTMPIDVCTDYGHAYGQSMAYDKQAPIGAQKARIIRTVDKDRLWELIYDYCANF
ncbi:MAG: nucleoside hydrolase [Prevotellaceae bacterium]|jgi:inosine-uridine nucleoside N-ribohydrolase|nr:nucleoside hydrolase [Prevotellaceae bacterium]